MTEVKRRLYEEFTLNKVLVIAPKKVAEDTWTPGPGRLPSGTICGTCVSVQCWGRRNREGKHWKRKPTFTLWAETTCSGW